ncbi:DUF2207 domain-containing protein [Candidatus Roizmanbacteria bacterium]|nr:DUF2207 domain-containing protein [Candidatus Roizmanbacteria bacterium]
MKYLFYILIILFIFFQFNSPALAQEQIQSFVTNILVNKDGTINVEEKIVYDFSNLERRGIYRDIPYIKKNEDGKKFRLDITNISVRDEEGNSYQFKKTDENGKLRLKVGDPNKTITGVYTYFVRYQVFGALTYFSDHDELYWNVTGNDWPVPIAFSTSGVELPVGIGQNEISVTCYTGSAGSVAQNCAYEIKDSLVHFQTQNQLNPGEGLTIVVKFPKNIVSVLEPKPYLTFWETILGKITAGILILLATFWYLLYPLKIIYKWFKFGRDPKSVSVGETRAWYDAPKTPTGRFLTPEETGSLVDERADQEDISGMIVQLAQRGYFKIVEKKKAEFSFKKQKNLDQAVDLLPYQKEFLEKVFGLKEEVVLKKSNLYQEIEAVKKKIYANQVKQGFFPHNPESIRTFYTVIGVLALTTGNLFLLAVAFMFGRNMPRKTLKGVEAANKAKSLRNFLVSQERQLEFQAKNQMMFEKLLPYAIVFGVEKIWADRFKDIQMKSPDWYQGYGMSSYNSHLWVRNMNSSFSSIRSAAATPTSSSSGFGSGFSGGSSGGGGGGGGGGSW